MAASGVRFSITRQVAQSASEVYGQSSVNDEAQQDFLLAYLRGGMPELSGAETGGPVAQFNEPTPGDKDLFRAPSPDQLYNNLGTNLPHDYHRGGMPQLDGAHTGDPVAQLSEPIYGDENLFCVPSPAQLYNNPGTNFPHDGGSMSMTRTPGYDHFGLPAGDGQPSRGLLPTMVSDSP
jgi:hypothetical protein